MIKVEYFFNQYYFMIEKNKLLDFEAIQVVMENKIGRNDPFLT